MNPHDGKNLFVVRTHRSPSDTHSLSLSSLLQSWHGVSLSLPSLPSSVPAATCREPSDPCNTLSSATSSLVPLSYLPRREERSREQIAGAACEGVGIPRKTVAQYPNYRKSRGAISASAAVARCCVAATRFKFRTRTHPQISNAKLSIRQGTNRLALPVYKTEDYFCSFSLIQSPSFNSSSS